MTLRSGFIFNNSFVRSILLPLLFCFLLEIKILGSGVVFTVTWLYFEFLLFLLLLLLLLLFSFSFPFLFFSSFDPFSPDLSLFSELSFSFSSVNDISL